MTLTSSVTACVVRMGRMCGSAYICVENSYMCLVGIKLSERALQYVVKELNIFKVDTIYGDQTSSSSVHCETLRAKTNTRRGKCLLA